MYHKRNFIGIPPELVRLGRSSGDSSYRKLAIEHSMAEEEQQIESQTPINQLTQAVAYNHEIRTEVFTETAGQVKYPVEHAMRIVGKLKCQ